ncbi:hypothetical protein F5Y19DRAFT_383183 [Xylariaceae sp. FL1651]|nr:hypothetical protein F5Y19DRAFT_383183 [Xylariaceae sp. FL1651]
MLSDKRSEFVGAAPSPTLKPAGQKSYVWRIWRHSKTRLGCVLTSLFSTEAMFLLLACAFLHMWHDQNARVAAQRSASASAPKEMHMTWEESLRLANGGSDPRFRPPPTMRDVWGEIWPDSPFVWGLWLNCVIVAVLFATCSLPTSKWHLPIPVYSAVLLHQEQVRAGPTHRRFILAAKIVVLLLSGTVLWVWAKMPGVHRQYLGEELRLVSGHGLDGVSESKNTWTVVLGSVMLFLDAFAILWAYAVVLIMIPTMVMDACICFAWSPTPDMFTIEELRAMAKAEEAKGEEAVDAEIDAPPLPLSFVWTVQRKLAGLGENMVAFASRQC